MNFYHSDKLETSSDFLIQRQSKVLIIWRKEPVGMTFEYASTHIKPPPLGGRVWTVSRGLAF